MIASQCPTVEHDVEQWDAWDGPDGVGPSAPKKPKKPSAAWVKSAIDRLPAITPALEHAVNVGVIAEAEGHAVLHCEVDGAFKEVVVLQRSAAVQARRHSAAPSFDVASPS